MATPRWDERTLEWDPRANPLAAGPLRTRDDVARAVIELYEPLRPHVSTGGARVSLGSFASMFEASTAELEGFARPLYGIVPLTVGGGHFPYWERFSSGLDAGTDPGSAEYWGPVPGDGDQRMVEQAAIGLALAFCPERSWEPLGPAARDRLVDWLHGIFEHDPIPNNWQFFRVLVALGLERVGAPFDRSAVDRSLDMIDSYRIGDHWYGDGALRNVDYYVPFAFHTYGLMYAAANDVGLGDSTRAAALRERAAAFASDFQYWFAPGGASIPFGRSLTYRFAMASFWGMLAWADVDSGLSWGTVKGLSMRHLRWWADKPISDRDGVLSIGFTYDNRRLCETYSSAGSPYWAMKAFGALAAAGDHPFWSSDEEPLVALDAPITIVDAGQVIARGLDHAVMLTAREAPALDFPEQGAAKYRKFAYSSSFGFSGDVVDIVGSVHTDSMLALTDTDGNRRVRLGVDAAGVEPADRDAPAMTWATWRPWPDVRVDSVCWAVDSSWHGRIHRVRTDRRLNGLESGFAVGLVLPDDLDGGGTEVGAGRPGMFAQSMEPGSDEGDGDRVGAWVILRTAWGGSAVVDLNVGSHVGHSSVNLGRTATARNLAVNANIVHPRTAVPVLRGEVPPGDHLLATMVFASPSSDIADQPVPMAVPTSAAELLDRIAAQPPDDTAATAATAATEAEGG